MSKPNRFQIFTAEEKMILSLSLVGTLIRIEKGDLKGVITEDLKTKILKLNNEFLEGLHGDAETKVQRN